MKMFRKIKSIQILNDVIIDQVKKNTDLIIEMYNKHYIQDTEILRIINEKLLSLEEQALDNTHFIDEVLYNEMMCVKRLIDKIIEIVPYKTYKQYNDIVLVANIMFSKDMILDTIELCAI